MDLIELAQEKGLQPKRTSSRGGDEYHCACPNPNCDADDNGFTIWPNAMADKCVGRYWCRKCDVKGDTIQFCRAYLGLSWEEACKRLNIAPGEFPKENKVVSKKPEAILKLAKEPPLIWQNRASAFISWCHAHLLKTPEALNKLYVRGFSEESINKFKLGYCPEDIWREYPEWGLEPEVKTDGKSRKIHLAQGLIIPWFDPTGKVLKIKVRSDDAKITEKFPNKYTTINGSMRCPAIYGDPALRVGILVESEFDALLIQQFAGDLIFCIANGGSRQPIDFYTDHVIKKAPLILLCPDVDEGGAFLIKLQSEYRNMKLWSAPIGKSPGDALKDHGVDIREWILQGIPKPLKETLNKTYDFTCSKCSGHSYWTSIFDDVHCLNCVSPAYDETLVASVCKNQ